jgi:KDO2-lipid IV(A) lauroyltransferase
MRILSRVPLEILYRISDLLFPVIYWVVRYRRPVVRRNLLRSFPEKSLDEIKLIERKFYRYFCDILMETVRQLSISEQEMRSRMVFSNEELMMEQLRKGKSVMLMTGHYCNWEWGLSVSYYTPDGFKVYPVYQRLNNAGFEELMLEIRGHLGGYCVEKDELVRTMFRLRKENKHGVYGMISDQSPLRKFIRYRMEFLNQDTPVFLGTEQLARKYDYPVFYLDIRRVGRGYYECEVVPVSLEPALSAEYEITNRFMLMLEQSIHRQPEFWLWSHNRWKHSNSKDPIL